MPTCSAPPREPPDAEFLIDLDDCRLRHAPPELAEYVEALAALQRRRSTPSPSGSTGGSPRSSRATTAPTARARTPRERSTSTTSSCAPGTCCGPATTSVRAAAHERFHLVLVDEFQDTNRLQCELIDLVAAEDAERVFVGDEFQSIYRFRHADVEVFRSAATAPSQVALQGNYRSRPEVLAVVNHLFGRVFGDAYRTLDAVRRFDGAASSTPSSCASWTARGAAGAELARGGGRARGRARAGDRRRRRARRGGVVVLLRSATDADDLRAGARRGASRRTRDRARLLRPPAGARPVRLPAPCCATATTTARCYVCSPRRSSGSRTTGSRACAARRERGSSRHRADAARGPARADAGLLRAFRQRYDRLVRAGGELGLEALLERIVRSTTTSSPASRARRRAALRQRAQARAPRARVRGAARPRPRRLRRLRGRARRREADAPTADEEGGDAVRLMTIHAAKGLEFPVVVVADCGRASPSAAEDVIALPDGRLRLPRPRPAGSAAPAGRLRRGARGRAGRGRARERAITYVAITRAVDRLIISGGWLARDASPLAWMLDEIGVEVGALEPGAPHVHALRSGVQLLVHVRRPGDPTRRPCRARRPSRARQLSLFDVRARERRACADRDAPPLPPLPTAPAHVPRALSFSALALHDRCGFRYYAERVIGLRTGRRVARRCRPRAAPARATRSATPSTCCSRPATPPAWTGATRRPRRLRPRAHRRPARGLGLVGARRLASPRRDRPRAAVRVRRGRRRAARPLDLCATRARRRAARGRPQDERARRRDRERRSWTRATPCSGRLRSGRVAQRGSHRRDRVLLPRAPGRRVATRYGPDEPRARRRGARRDRPPAHVRFAPRPSADLRDCRALDRLCPARRLRWTAGAGVSAHPVLAARAAACARSCAVCASPTPTRAARSTSRRRGSCSSRRSSRRSAPTSASTWSRPGSSRYPGPEAFAAADQARSRAIFQTGFHNQKARSLRGAGQAVLRASAARCRAAPTSS